MAGEGRLELWGPPLWGHRRPWLGGHLVGRPLSASRKARVMLCILVGIVGGLQDFFFLKKLELILLSSDVFVIVSSCRVLWHLLLDDLSLVPQVLKDLSISLLLTLV